jgi:hypothetical protein
MTLGSAGVGICVALAMIAPGLPVAVSKLRRWAVRVSCSQLLALGGGLIRKRRALKV